MIKKITLWHQPGIVPAWDKTLTLFDGETPPPDELKKEDGLEPGYFLTLSDLQALWDAAREMDFSEGVACKFSKMADYLKSTGVEGE